MFCNASRWLTLLTFYQFASSVFNALFLLLFVTIKITLDSLLPVFPAALQKNTWTPSHSQKKLAQLNQTVFFRRESSRDCHSKCVTKLLQSHGESMVSYAKPLSFRSDSGHRYQSNPEFRTATLNPVSKQLIAAQISALFTGINQLDRPLCCLARLPPASQGSSVWCSCLCGNVWYSLSLE